MASSPQKPRLLQRVRNTCRRRHLSIHTEKAYVNWIKRFALFHDKTHPAHLDENHISEYLTYLATERHVAASTQNQALSALLFLYRHVLDVDLAKNCSGTRPSEPP
jgi:site-specific recombinase XerD